MTFGYLFATILQTLFVSAFVYIMIPFRFSRKKSFFLYAVVVVILCILSGYLTLYQSSLFFYRYGTIVLSLPAFLVIYLLSKAKGVRFLFVAFTTMIFHHMISSLLAVFWLSTGKGFTLSYLLLNILLHTGLLMCGYHVRKDFHRILFTYGTEFVCLCPILLLLFGMMNLFSPVTDSGGVDMDLLYLCLGIYLLIILLYLYISATFHSLSKHLEAERNALTLQHQIGEAEEHIALLQEFQTKTAIHHHDLRHHLAMLEELLEAGQTQELGKYLSQMQMDLDGTSYTQYCQNEAANLLLCSFTAKAEKLGISLEPSVRLPHSLPIENNEFCAILSNALENALTATSWVTDGREKKVCIVAELFEGKLLVLVENPYIGNLHMVDGFPTSSRKNHGFGIKSIQTIVTKYSGLFSCQAQNGTFTLRIVI